MGVLEKFHTAGDDEMQWLIKTCSSSVGKKFIMAVTGMGFVGFLGGHLAGNLTIFAGKDSFLSYAHHLHSLGPLVTVAEGMLLAMAVIHISTGLILVYQNFQARPVKYAVNKRAGGRTIGSATMPYTGIFVLCFVVFHLANFHFVDKTHTNIFAIVSQTFSNPVYVFFYVAAMIVVAIHITHGFWSAFQTMGVNHSKYMPLVQILGIGFSIAVGIGFGTIPIYVSMGT